MTSISMRSPGPRVKRLSGGRSRAALISLVIVTPWAACATGPGEALRSAKAFLGSCRPVLVQPKRHRRHKPAEARTTMGFILAGWVRGRREVPVRENLGADIIARDLHEEALHKCPDGKVHYLRADHPRVLAHINDVSGLQFEISMFPLKNVVGIHYKGLRMIERAAHDEHATLESPGRESTAVGDRADHRALGVESHYAGSCHFAQHVNLIGAGGRNVQV